MDQCWRTNLDQFSETTTRIHFQRRLFSSRLRFGKLKTLSHYVSTERLNFAYSYKLIKDCHNLGNINRLEKCSSRRNLYSKFCRFFKADGGKSTKELRNLSQRQLQIFLRRVDVLKVQSIAQNVGILFASHKTMAFSKVHLIRIALTKSLLPC